MAGSWTERITKPLGLVGSIIGAATVIVGVSTSTLDTALYWSVAAYLAGLAILGVVLFVWCLHDGETRSAFSFLGVAGAIVLPLSYALYLEYDSMARFGRMQILGLFFIGGVVYIAVDLIRDDWREKHKPCPECFNNSSREARICHHCGYRWRPPLRGLQLSLRRGGRRTRSSG